jgi:hypothetical protein
MKQFLSLIGVLSATILFFSVVSAQNIFSGEPVQVVGQFNGYQTNPYNSDYRTTAYRRMSITSGNPNDGRGQWATTINVQSSGGDVTPINMSGGGGNGFLFISGPSGNRFQNKWVFSSVGQGAVNGVNTITAFNSGNDMGLNMSTAGRYTFVFNDAGYTATNARYYVGYTTNTPVSVTHAGQSFSGNALTISISTNATPSTGENVYVRYTSGSDFSGTSATSIVQATGSGTNWSASITSVPCGTTFRYYVFTSTRTLAQLNAHTESERSIAVLRYDDNSGNNYTYNLSNPTAFTVTGGGTYCAGGTGVAVGLSGSQNGVSYQLHYNGNNLGSAIIGNGGTLNFGDQTLAGTYDVTASNGSCSSTMTGSVSITIDPGVTYYQDNDGDGFGNNSVSQVSCTGAPSGYVVDNTDCNDNELQYVDADADGFGSTTLAACGVTNSTDCNDNDPLNAAPAKPSPGIFNPGQRNLCSESMITLSVTNDPSANSYTWTLAPGFSGTSTSNSIVVSPSGAFGQATFTVTANNGCGSSPSRNINIWGTPNKPIVSGPTCVNQNQTGITYTVSNAEPGVTYTWTLPNNVGNQTPLTGTSITVDWNRPNPAKIKVIGSNSCGAGLRGSLSISVGGCSITAKSEQQVLVYPNPTNGQTNVLLTVNKDSKATIVVFDVAGKQLQRKEWAAMAGQNRIGIDMSSYPNGMYLFSIITSEGVQTLKVIKGQ